MKRLALLLLALLLSGPAAAAITFIPGTNVTAERLAGLQAAANELGGLIRFRQEIKISVSFSSLTCSASGAVLGYAGPQTAYANFSGAPQTSVWYVSAQVADYGIADAMDDTVHIAAQFNHNLGNTGCLDGITWYYGADHNPGVNQVDFVRTAVHEFMHGLGFLSFIGSNGALNGGLIDNYSTFLYDNTAGKGWKTMTQAERAASILNNGNLVWNGNKANSMNSLLSAGTSSNRIRLFAPATYQSGSSTGHFDTALYYQSGHDEVMEPYSMPALRQTLAVAAFCDMGWQLLQDTDGDGSNDCSDVFPLNAIEWLDTDGDGIGNNADWDDDGDGVPDAVDAGPLDPANKGETVLPLDGGYGGGMLNETVRVD